MTSTASSLIPAVFHLEPRPGCLALGAGLALQSGPGCEAGAALLGAWLPVRPGPASLPLLRLSLEPGLELAAPRGASAQARLEAYRLELGPEGGRLSAAKPEGLLRGAATLYQLALGATAIESCLIEDCPRFAWRGFMLDAARNFFEPAFIERLLDLAALHRLNVFHWHLSDDQAWRLDLPGLPELAQVGSKRLDRRYNVERWKQGSYSPEDVRRVVAYAAARGITIVPEIETPGHVVALLASHPELSCQAALAKAAGTELPSFAPEDRYGVFDDILCAGNEDVFVLLDKVFAGLAELFPGPWVHVGGDEAPKLRWRECPRCAHRLDSLGLSRNEEGLESLQAWFMGRVAALLASRGKKMLGWDEILDGRPLASAPLPADALILSWRGYKGGQVGARRGHGVIMCPQTKACYLDHKQSDSPGEAGQLGVCTLKDSWSFDPLPPGLSASEETLILGGQANIWTELMYFEGQVEYMVFPRLCALSEALWRPRGEASYQAFIDRLRVHAGRLDILGVNYRRGSIS